jgi:hypothetical protein
MRIPSVDGLNKDEDMTREPEMMKAYRATWELGLHSYLTYLRADFLKAAMARPDMSGALCGFGAPNA